MKIRRKLAAMLAFAVLTGSMTVGASAASADDFKDMPDDWSRAALTHAVENGLLNGTDGLIDPQGLLTRAQLAAIVNRAFGAETVGDISGFTDVPSSEWYYSDMQKAVHMGTFQGSNGKLNPGSAISRQEALTVLARAFRLSGGADAALAGFSDAGEVASWAKGSVAALAAAGYVSGSNGKLNPTASITRAEFAQVMDNLLPTYLPEKFEGTVDGNAMVRTAGTVLNKATIKGDLVIGDGVGNGDVTLRDTKVTGRLVVRGGGVNSIIIIGSSDVGSVVVSKVDGNVRVAAQGGAELSVVVVDDGKDDVIIEGTVAKVEVAGGNVPVILQNATVNDVVVSGGSSTVTVDKASEVKTLTVNEAAKDTAVSVSGKVTDVKTEATGTAVTVASTGKVDTVAVADTASNSTVTADKGASVSKVETAASGTEVKGDGKVDKVEAQAGSEGTKVTTPSTDVTADKDAGAVDTGKNEVKPGETGKTEGNTPSGGGSSGGSSGPSYTVVNDADSLKKALEAGGYVRLEQNIAISSDTMSEVAGHVTKTADGTEYQHYAALVVGTGKSATLDLNGKTLSAEGKLKSALKADVNVKNFIAVEGALTVWDSTTASGKITAAVESETVSGVASGGGTVIVYSGGSLNLQSGTIENTGTLGHPSVNAVIGTNLGNVTMSGGTLSAQGSTYYGNYGISNYTGSRFTMTGGTINADYAVGLFQDCTVDLSGNSAVNGMVVSNGKIGYEGYTLNISGDTQIMWTNSGDNAMYLPSAGITTISGNPTITGQLSAIEIRAGSLTMNGGTLVATAVHGDGLSTTNGASGNLTGALVAVKSQHTSDEGYKGDINVTINGGTLTNNTAGGDALSVVRETYQTDGYTNADKITVSVSDDVVLNGNVYSKGLDVDKGDTFTGIMPQLIAAAVDAWAHVDVVEIAAGEGGTNEYNVTIHSMDISGTGAIAGLADIPGLTKVVVTSGSQTNAELDLSNPDQQAFKSAILGMLPQQKSDTADLTITFTAFGQDTVITMHVTNAVETSSVTE